MGVERALARCVLVLFLAAPAAAENMMRPGPSPEAGFAGVWRIIEAKPAPWAKPRSLTKSDAPLLEYAVDFKNGEVRGPAPLACTSATYSSGDMGRSEMFGGKLAGGHGDAMLKTLHLTNPSTYRVVCNGAMRNYYIDDAADMVMAEGDVVYTLERPTGMDPEQYHAGYSGPSFDCTAATATGDRLICRDAQLSKSDTRLGKSYRALEASESPASFATFRAGQRAWLAFTMKNCGANRSMPDTAGDRGPIVECLNTAYGDRADLFDGLKARQAGPLVLEPRLRFRTRATPDTEESDIYPWMRGGPQAAAFNAFIVKVLRLDAWRMDDARLFRYDDDVNGMRLHARRSYAVQRFDGRVVSVDISKSDFVGGHDEEHGETALNWQLDRAQPIRLEDVFSKGSDWKSFVTGYCMKNLRKQTAQDNMPADLDISDVGATVANSDKWLWGSGNATVMFAIFMNSGMPQGEYAVDIPYALLKPFMKAGAPPV